MQNGAKLEQEVLNGIKSLRLSNITIKKHSITGLSGNKWNVDIVVARTSKAKRNDVSIATKDVLTMIECKDVRSRKASTYDTQLKRAYAELGDLQNVICPKFVIVSKKRKWQGKHFNYDSYFDGINVKLVGWDKEEKSVYSGIKKIILNSKWYKANHYPGRERYKAKWVRENR
jgi:hypothetical protein